MNAADPRPALRLAAHIRLSAIIHSHRASCAGRPSPRSKAGFSLVRARDRSARSVEEDARTMTGKHADTSFAKALYAESLDEAVSL